MNIKSIAKNEKGLSVISWQTKSQDSACFCMFLQESVRFDEILRESAKFIYLYSVPDSVLSLWIVLDFFSLQNHFENDNSFIVPRKLLFSTLDVKSVENI